MFGAGHHTLLKEDSLKAAYEKFDVKGTGTITVEDLELAFGSKKHAQEVFDLVDANGDGEGSTRERTSQLQRLRSRPVSTRFG